MKIDLSPWYRWQDREDYSGTDYPGIYVTAITSKGIHGREFSVRPEIVYVGMTVSQGGLRSRSRQFDYMISPKKNGYHGGADRVAYKHRNYGELCPQLYVAMGHVVCDPSSRVAKDLRLMGEVVRAEYEYLARYQEEHAGLPEFNLRTSPKYSKHISEL